MNKKFKPATRAGRPLWVTVSNNKGHYIQRQVYDNENGEYFVSLCGFVLPINLLNHELTFTFHIEESAC